MHHMNQKTLLHYKNSSSFKKNYKIYKNPRYKTHKSFTVGRSAFDHFFPTSHPSSRGLVCENLYWFVYTRTYEKIANAKNKSRELIHDSRIDCGNQVVRSL